MPQVITCPTPHGTIHGDLSTKLREDILRALKRYYELSKLEDIEDRLILSGALSALLYAVVFMEDCAEIPSGVSEKYLEMYRQDIKDNNV